MNIKVYSAAKLAKLVAAQKTKDEKKSAAFKIEQLRLAEELRAWRANHLEPLGLFCKVLDDPFVASLVEQADRRPLTDNQLAAGVKAAERALARKTERENAPDCPEGRIEIVGEVVKTDERESEYGPVWKMLVKSEAGWLVWCSVPRGLPFHINDLKNKNITFTATVERSQSDSKFGFGKRPTVSRKERKGMSA